MRPLLIPAVVASTLISAGVVVAPAHLRWWFIGTAIPVVVGSLLSYLPPHPERRNALFAGVFTLISFVPVRLVTRRLLHRNIDLPAEAEMFGLCVASAIVLVAVTVFVARQHRVTATWN
jgi:hypothetical protein